MSFRRDKEKTLQWQKWLRKHRDELLACGIPHLVLDDMLHWYYFLDHCYFTPVGSSQPIVCIDHMNQADALRLCLFLEQDDLYPGCSALNRLQYLLRRGQHAGPEP